MSYAYGFQPYLSTGGSGSSSRFTVNDSVTASTTITQVGATAITAQYTRVTAGGALMAVVLPSAPTIGQIYVVELARASSELVIFPQVGGSIDAQSANALLAIYTGSFNAVASLMLVATSATHWTSMIPFGCTASAPLYVVKQPSIFDGLMEVNGGITMLSGGLSAISATFSGSVAYTPAAALTPSGATQTVDFSTGSTQIVDLTSASASCALTLTNAVKWPGGVAPVITASAGAVDIVSLDFIGTQHYGTFSQAFA